jgi:acid phosphatase
VIRTRVAALTLAVLLAVPACSASHPAASSSSAPAAVRYPSPAPPPSSLASPTSTGSPSAEALSRPNHVLVAIFENKAYTDIVGNPNAPYLDGLLGRSAVFTAATAITHPSQPNYLALFSGSTQGVTNDHCPVRAASQPNLASQLAAAGLSFVGYSEDLPAAGYRGCNVGRYAAKHNPWADFDNVPASANQPYSAFPADYAALPTVAFVVPNICNDMHDCGVATGDRWAAAHLDGYLRWADAHNSLLVVTFDENDGSAGNRILTLIAGAHVRPGRYPEPVTHYRVLRTIEALYGLSPIGQAAATEPITDVWVP